MTFGENLKRLLKENRMTPEELAKKIGVSLSTIYRYCDETIEPKAETLKKISLALNVSIDELLCIVENIKKENNDIYAKIGKNLIQFMQDLPKEERDVIISKLL